MVSPEVQEEPLPSQVMNEEGVGVVMLSELRTREKEMGSALQCEKAGERREDGQNSEMGSEAAQPDDQWTRAHRKGQVPRGSPCAARQQAHYDLGRLPPHVSYKASEDGQPPCFT